MTCFTDIVGISYCQGDAAPSSRLYINSLPGISVESMDKVADAEQITYKGLWSDVQKSAQSQFKLEIIAEMNKCYALNKECDYEALICENVEELTLAWQYLLAVWLMTFRLASDRVNRYTTIDRGQAKELRDFYQVKYEDTLKQGVQLMNTDSCQLCCDGNPQIITWLP